MTVVQAFAGFAADIVRTPLPAPVMRHAKRAVIDWHAALIAGAREAPAALLERALADELGKGSAKLALGGLASPRAAALINGTAAHTMEVDDIYFEAIFHPGAPAIAAALAAAHTAHASGQGFLNAVVVGYEISTRIGAGMGRAHYKYWHTTGTVGTFGAAAAAAAIFELDVTRFAHALATAATFAAGLHQAFRMDSMSKPLHAGRAAEGGLLAAMAAREGVTGSLDVMEGEAGFGRAMGAGPDWEKVLASLGKRFNIEQITFKNHACCGHTFAAIDGALELQRRLKVAARDIARVRVETYGEALAVAGNPSPKTAAEARFSIPYVVASALAHGSVRLAAFENERLNDMQTRALMQHVALAVEPGLDASFPRKRGAVVEIATKDGRTERMLQPTRKGDPDLPLTDAELNEKYLELTIPIIGKAKAAALLERLWRLDSEPTVDLVSAFAPAEAVD